MASRMRTRNGLERPPSGSLKTSESAEKDHQTHECLRHIGEQCDLTQESFDYLLKLLIDRSSLQISILRSCDIHGKLFNLANSNFVAPLFHPITQNWSVIYVQTIVDSGRCLISSVPTLVGNMERTKVNYTHEEGPAASHKNATGIYALMGALDFGTHHSFQSKDKFWGGDPVTTIKGALQATRPRYPPSGGTPARRGSSVCSTGNGAEGMRTPAKTPRNATRDGWELPSCDELDVFGAHTPPIGRRRRRLDLVDPIAFNVKEKLETATSSILNLSLPSVTGLQQEVDERRKERSEHNEVVEKKKKELETCQDKRASLARIHEECEKACTELEIKLNDDERRVSKWLSEFPLDLNFAIDTERYKTPGEDRWKPERINLMEAQNRKRKANESLDSANEDLSYLRRVVDNVLEEGRVIEEGVKTAYMKKEFVAIKERHLEDQRAFLLRFEGDDWEKKLDARGG